MNPSFKMYGGLQYSSNKNIVKSNIKVRKILDKESSANTGEDVKYSEDYIRNLQYHIGTYYNN